MSESHIHVVLAQKQDYQFDISFGANVPPILGDEPAPLGQGIPIVVEVFDKDHLRLKPQ
jgi:hypothetical protein